ncbi:hypothetical protein [Pandoraea sp. PE-S2T-3]|uniref:hypothetical protein n=1 Tax=Pandoraea sp. PE-S2T-3 TaxID=1986993 RepID=UPI001594FC78|nr:hypothetical protein [Pandoraea sp. PE-S2T-3]
MLPTAIEPSLIGPAASAVRHTSGGKTWPRNHLRESPALCHAGRVLAERREPARSTDIERYLHRWFTHPPSVLVTLASDSELLARNADYPTLSCDSRRFGDIAYSTYVLAQNLSPLDGIFMRTCVVTLTQGDDIVTFPAVQAWTRDTTPIVHAEALVHLHQITERLRIGTPARHTHRSSFYSIETVPLVARCLAVQAIHRTARLGMWLAMLALFERGNASLDNVLRDIRIGTLRFDPTFAQYQELTRLARMRHRRASAADMSSAFSTSRFALPSTDSPSLPRTPHDAKPAPLS